MKITVQVKTNAKKESVELLPDGTYLARVNVPPVEGRANERARDLLAKFFRCSKTFITLVHGHKSRKKVFDL